jgi:hypothetical protein
MSMSTETADPGLVHWTSLPGRKQALEFSARGWAIAEVCAALGDFPTPQDLIGQMLGRIINGFIESGASPLGGELQVSWQIPEGGLTATAAFEIDALEAVAGVFDMELGELQSAIQSSLELSLLELYNEHNDKLRLH